MSGKEFLTAAVAGYEIGPRVGLCMGPEHIAQGWHSGATLGVFSAAAGAARGLKLDVDKTVHALGIAGTQAAGLMAAQYGAMVKRMHAGRSSQSGLYGALFADAGLHRHRQRAGKRIRRLLHDVLALDRPLQARRAHRGLRLGVADDGRRAQVLFVRRQQPHDARRDPRSCSRSARSAPTTSKNRRARLAGHDGPRRLEIRAAGAHLRAAQPALLRRDLLLEGDCFVDQFTEDKVADPLRMKHAEKVDGEARRRDHRQGLEVPPHGARRGHLNDGTRMERTGRSRARQRKQFRVRSRSVRKIREARRRALPKAQVESCATRC